MIKKMLVGFLIDGKHSGIDKYLLGFAKVAKENGVILDFLTDKIDADLSAKLSADGFGLIQIPSLKKPLEQYRAIKKILEGSDYDAVYYNISEAFNCTGILAAKKCGIPVRIVHSHSAGVDKANKYVREFRTFLHKCFRSIIAKNANVFYACSERAGKWMYDCDFKIIYNSVDTKKFSFDPQKRVSVRNELGISETTPVLVHVGNMCYAKNNFFLMDIMYELIKTVDNAVLLCVGTGVDEKALKEYAKELCVDSNVKFLGVRSDIADILSASDVFVFPSRFEGMPVTCIEAQSNGIPCVISKTAGTEVKLCDNVVLLDLNVKKWLPEIMSALNKKRVPAILDEDVIAKYSFENSKNQLAKILERD